MNELPGAFSPLQLLGFLADPPHQSKNRRKQMSPLNRGCIEAMSGTGVVSTLQGVIVMRVMLNVSCAPGMSFCSSPYCHLLCNIFPIKLYSSMELKCESLPIAYWSRILAGHIRITLKCLWNSNHMLILWCRPAHTLPGVSWLAAALGNGQKFSRVNTLVMVWLSFL